MNLNHLTEEQRHAVRTGSVSDAVTQAICGSAATWFATEAPADWKVPTR